jgi:uncharacterized OB-fold protein
VTSAFAVAVCEACGEAVYPARAVCPRCGAERWRQRSAPRGVVEEATVHRGVRIASVRTDVGPVVIARLEDDVPEGSAVSLHLEGSAPVAVAAPSGRSPLSRR